MSYGFNPFTGNFDETKAHNLLSGLHLDTLAAAAVRGSLIVGNSTPKWSAFALGSVDKVLASDGTDLVWKDKTGSGSVVLATSPTLVTPVLGIAAATSIFNTLNGIGSADYALADDAIRLTNTTAATSGVTLQASPSLRFTAHGWISGADHKSEIILALQPAITNFAVVGAETGRPGHTLYFYSTTDDGTPFEAARLQGNGNLILRSSIDVAYNNSDVGDISLSAGGGIYWRGAGDTAPSRVGFGSNARGLLQIYGTITSPSTLYVEHNMGTAAPTVTTCGTGSIGANSNNSKGYFTSTGATTCTVTFGAPNWTIAPSCWVQEITRLATLRISVINATSFTVTGQTAGDVIMYGCTGGA